MENEIIERYTKSHGYPPDVIETDPNTGEIIGCGSHADYDYYAVQVQNEEGYYDVNGHFQYFGGEW